MRLAIVALLASAPVYADIGIRAGGELLLARHDSKGTTIITDELHPSAGLMISYWLPANIISVDLEVAEAFKASSPAAREGTTVRLGATFSVPVLPIYFRGAIPIHLEPSPFYAGLRLGAGATLNVLLAKFYLELDADFPLFGGSGSPSGFDRQDISLGAGVQFKF